MSGNIRGSDFRRQHDRPDGQTVVDAIVEESGLGETPERGQESRSWVKDFVAQLSREEFSRADGALSLVEGRIAELDELIATQINQVLHNAEFQNLESAWRGLHYLVQETANDQNIGLQIYSATVQDLANDSFLLHLRDLEIDERIGNLGAEPFSAFIGIYEFTKERAAIRTLRQLGKLAANAHAPFLTAVHPSMLGSGSLSDMSVRKGLTQELELDDSWQHLVHDPVSQHLLLALPRVLMRQPYQKDRETPRYSHDEKVDGRDSSVYLWGSPLWPIVTQLAHAFSAGSWCADLSAGTNTRVSHGFPFVWIQCDEGDVQPRGPLEITFSESALHQLRKSGLTPLTCDLRTKRIVIEEPQTLNRDRHSPAQTDPAGHTLRETIGRSRLEQYIISIARELQGRVTGPDQLLHKINHWVETNFPGNSNALHLEALADDRFLVKGVIVAAGSSVSFHISVPVRWYLTKRLEGPEAASLKETAQSNSPAANILAEVTRYFELLQQSAELNERGLISGVEQELIKRSILKKVHYSLDDSLVPNTGRMHSPAPLLITTSPTLEDRRNVHISFDSAQTATAGDYAILFDVIDKVHSLLCPYSFEVERVHKASPGEIFGAAFAPVAQALSQILSLGNQIRDLRLASVKVQEAKLDLSRKEIEFGDYKRRMEVKWRVTELEETIEAARQEAELEEVRKKRDEAIRDRTKLVMDELAQKYDLISKALPILQTLPPAMQEEFRRDLSIRLERLGETSLVITDVRQFDAIDDLPM